jgi:CheY-like chemotaxis protein
MKPPLTAESAPHLLMAEDEPDLAAVMEDYLKEAGYRVTKAADGMEALEVLPTASFDLLLTDIRMPRLDGVKLVRRVRQTHPSMPIVVFSGYMTEEDRRSLGRLGVPDDAVLEKPSPFLTLEETIRTALAAGP